MRVFDALWTGVNALKVGIKPGMTK